MGTYILAEYLDRLAYEVAESFIWRDGIRPLGMRLYHVRST